MSRNDLSLSALSHRGSRSAAANKSSKAPQVVINESLESLKKIIELDTDSSLSDLSLLEKLNNEATSRYRSIGQNISTVEENSKIAENSIEEVKSIGSKIDQLETQVDKLLGLVSEIDEWSKELEVKSRRYTR